jgi:hypothetical protein
LGFAEEEAELRFPVRIIDWGYSKENTGGEEGTTA